MTEKITSTENKDDALAQLADELSQSQKNTNKTKYMVLKKKNNTTVFPNVSGSTHIYNSSYSCKITNG